MMHFELYRTLFTRQWRWRLRGSNHEIIAHGESYKRKVDAKDAINLVKIAGVTDVPVVEL